MPLYAFLLLSGLFLIGTMANIAGNAYGNYLSIAAVCCFSLLMLTGELKRHQLQYAGSRRIRWGNMVYSVLLAAYLMALSNLSTDWSYSTTIYLLIALLLILYRLGQTIFSFFLLMFRKTGIRPFGKLLVFTCIDILFLAQVLMEELQVMDMRDWRLYTNTGFILLNSIFILQAVFEKGSFRENFLKRYPPSLGLSFYLITIGFVGYQSASDAGYMPKLYYAIFHSPETCRQEARMLKEGDFEALTLMKVNLSAFWNRHGERNILISRETPFAKSNDVQMNILFDPVKGLAWEIADIQAPSGK